MNITIGHLYPDLLNLYGDRGNIQCLRKTAVRRGIRAEVKEFRSGDKIDFQELDIVLLGGGSDREQMIVCNKLKAIPGGFQGLCGIQWRCDWLSAAVISSWENIIRQMTVLSRDWIWWIFTRSRRKDV